MNQIDDKKLAHARKFALDTARSILINHGIPETAKNYSIKLHELQFDIYHVIKKHMNLKSE